MDWTRTSGNFIRSFPAFSFFARSRSIRRDRRELGAAFLQLRAAQRFRRPRVHAGRSVAQFRADRSLFFPSLDRKARARHGTSSYRRGDRTGLAYKIDIFICQRGAHFTRALD